MSKMERFISTLLEDDSVMRQALTRRGFTEPPDCPTCRQNDKTAPISICDVGGIWYCIRDEIFFDDTDTDTMTAEEWEAQQHDWDDEGLRP